MYVEHFLSSCPRNAHQPINPSTRQPINPSTHHPRIPTSGSSRRPLSHTLLQLHSLHDTRPLIITPLLELLPIVRDSRTQTFQAQCVHVKASRISQETIYLTKIINRLGRHIAELALVGRDERWAPGEIALAKLDGRVLFAWGLDELGVLLGE